MKWSNLFNHPISVITEEEAKAFMDVHPIGSYQLVDVRTPEEYKTEHLPGAQLVPLNELVSGMGKLDPAKPTLVYCRSGGRSRAAAEWMKANGFEEIHDIGSNIINWMGLKLSGEYTSDLNLIDKNIDFPDAFNLAFAMEEGLKQFYLKLVESEQRADYKKTYQKLAGFEDIHMNRLLDSYKEKTGKVLDIKQAKSAHPKIIEGGEANFRSPFEIVDDLMDIQDTFSLALAIEAQSFDLYVRLANQSETKESKLTFMDLANEEKSHMNFITKELIKYIQQAA